MSDVVSLVNARAERDGYYLNNACGFVKNCSIQTRPNEKITYINGDGVAVIGLDGYAIIPKEEYVGLREKARMDLTFWQKIKLLITLN